MWRESEETPAKNAIKVDPTASARSSIRRLPPTRHRARHGAREHERLRRASPTYDRRNISEILRRERERDRDRASDYHDRDHRHTHHPPARTRNAWAVEVDESADAQRNAAEGYEGGAVYFRRHGDDGAIEIVESPHGPARVASRSSDRWEPDGPAPARSRGAAASDPSRAGSTLTSQLPHEFYERAWREDRQMAHLRLLRDRQYLRYGRPADLESPASRADLTPLPHGDLPPQQYSRRFAPAYRTSLSPRPVRVRRPSRSNLPRGSTGETLAPRSPSFSPPSLTLLPPLRRARHRSPSSGRGPHSPATLGANGGGESGSAPGIPLSHASGLGDRRRSVSPEEESTWETLFRTLTPDARLPTPSAGSSSFASAGSASTSAASLRRSGSGESGSGASTLLTVPTEGEEDEDEDEDGTFHVCVDDVSEMGEEEVDNWGRFFDRHHAELDMVDMGEEGVGLLPREERRYSGAERRSTDRWRSDRHAELQQMHAILERLERQEPVPDELWASAGLERHIRLRGEQTERGRL